MLNGNGEITKYCFELYTHKAAYVSKNILYPWMFYI